MKLAGEFNSSDWGIVGTVYTLYVSESVISETKSYINEITGNHESNKNNDDVEGVSFENCSISYFPRGLTEIFRNIIHLTIINSGLKILTRTDLIGLENIETIDMHDNKLFGSEQLIHQHVEAEVHFLCLQPFEVSQLTTAETHSE